MIKVWESKRTGDKYLIITYKKGGRKKVEILKVPIEYIYEALKEGQNA